PLPLYVYWLVAPRVLHSFPTRRSSDLRVRHELELRDLVRAHLAREDEGEVILQAGKERSPGLHEVPRPETDRELPITTKVVIDCPRHRPDRRDPPVDDVGGAGDSRDERSTVTVAVKIEGRDEDVDGSDGRKEVPEPRAESVSVQPGEEDHGVHDEEWNRDAEVLRVHRGRRQADEEQREDNG